MKTVSLSPAFTREAADQNSLATEWGVHNIFALKHQYSENSVSFHFIETYLENALNS